MYIPATADDPVGLLEQALAATMVAEPIEEKLRIALKKGRLPGKPPAGAGPEWLDARAVEAGVITADEAKALAKQRELAAAVVRVDDFDPDLGTSLLVPTEPVTTLPAAALQPRPHTSVRQRAAA